jgi:hypothetical protein
VHKGLSQEEAAERTGTANTTRKLHQVHFGRASILRPGPRDRGSRIHSGPPSPVFDFESDPSLQPTPYEIQASMSAINSGKRAKCGDMGVSTNADIEPDVHFARVSRTRGRLESGAILIASLRWPQRARLPPTAWPAPRELRSSPGTAWRHPVSPPGPEGSKGAQALARTRCLFAWPSSSSSCVSVAPLAVERPAQCLASCYATPPAP